MSADTIPALSIRQPWIWAILNAGKRVENRQWDPHSGNLAAARRLVGTTILLHASKGCTVAEYEGAGDFMRDIYRARPWEGSHIVPSLRNPELTRGALVTRATLADVVMTTQGHRQRWWENHRCSLCGDVTRIRDEAQCPKADPWAISGCVGLILADVVPLAAPVPFKGALGFFPVPASILEGRGS